MISLLSSKYDHLFTLYITLCNIFYVFSLTHTHVRTHARTPVRTHVRTRPSTRIQRITRTSYYYLNYVILPIYVYIYIYTQYVS